MVTLHGVCHQGKVTPDYHLWTWPLTTLVQTDCRILWPAISVERPNWCLRCFLRKDHQQVKIASKTNTVNWVWRGVALIQSDSRTLGLSVLLEWINWYLCLTIAILSFWFISMVSKGLLSPHIKWYKVLPPSPKFWISPPLKAAEAWNMNNIQKHATYEVCSWGGSNPPFLRHPALDPACDRFFKILCFCSCLFCSTHL